MAPDLFPSILPEDADSHHADPEAEAEAVADPDSVDGCLWCDEYEGDHWRQHASSAHVDEWAEFFNRDDADDSDGGPATASDSEAGGDSNA